MNDGKATRWHRIWLLVTIGMSGAAVMVCEVLGARMLSPFFGVGLFSWSALISVTLSALALGYFLGGGAAARRGSLRLFYRMVMLSAVFLALIPMMLEPILAFSEGVDLRWGALLSATLLFGPALVVLGMLSPMAVELHSREVLAAGRAAGRVFAISTFCGLGATLLVGFVLVPTFSISKTMTGTAAALLAAGVVGAFTARRSHGAAAVLLPLPWMLAGPPLSDEPLEGVHILHRSRSLYGDLAVVEDETRASSKLRLLRSDQSFVGAHWMELDQPAFGFVHLLEAVRLANPSGKDMLLIGLGIGSLSNELADDGVRTDIVEIDGEIVRLAREYFSYVPTGEVHVQDARTFVRRSQTKYDYIVHDTFTGGSTPEHLLSVEFLEETRQLLRSRGILALNLVGAPKGPLSEHAAAVFATLHHVFPHVRVFRDSSSEKDPKELGNLVFFAAAEPVNFAEPNSILFQSPACEHILRHFTAWEVTDALRGRGVVVTDDRNPLVHLSIPVSQAFRRSMRELYPREFWMP